MKKRKRSGRNRARKTGQRTLGGALDEIGWRPRGSRILVPAGTVGPMLKAYQRLEKALVEIAAEQHFGGPTSTATELETLEETTCLVKQAQCDPVHVVKSYDQHDVVDAAATYIESCLKDSRPKILTHVLSPTFASADERIGFYAGVSGLLRRYSQGLRLTEHRSGDAYEPLREPFVALFGNTRFRDRSASDMPL